MLLESGAIGILITSRQSSEVRASGGSPFVSLPNNKMSPLLNLVLYSGVLPFVETA